MSRKQWHITKGLQVISKSLYFDAALSQYLSRVFTGNNPTWSMCFWFKPIGSQLANLISAYQASNLYEYTRYEVSNAFRHRFQDYTTARYNYATTGTFPPGQWFQVYIDKYVASGHTDYWSISINGVNQAISGTRYATNNTRKINYAFQHFIGSFEGATNFLTGYMAQIAFFSNVRVGAAAVGEDDGGVWKPKDISDMDYSVTNSFLLEFKDGTDLNTLGHDTGGSGRHWTLNNMTVQDNWSSDVPG